MRDEGSLRLYVDAGETAMPQLMRTLETAGIDLTTIELHRPTLDDVFMSYTGSTIRDAEEDQSKHRNRVMMQMMTGGRR